MFSHALSTGLLWNALITALIVAIIAYIADFFALKAGLGFPRQIIWMIALVVWLLLVFGGG
jgi:hypothetical protein